MRLHLFAVGIQNLPVSHTSLETATPFIQHRHTLGTVAWNGMPLNEADTCRRYVVPLLQAAGWENDPHSVTEQRPFTDGRIVVRGNTAHRRPGKRADYILRHTRDLPIAVVEAKAEDKPAASGLEQAKEYAQILDLKFAYSTNGISIVEFDFTLRKTDRFCQKVKGHYVANFHRES